MASQNAAADSFVDTVSAAMPPGMRRTQETTTDELLRELNKVPLFMTSLEDGEGADGSENELLEAIKALAYEGTRAEVAANFREQGNECAREKRWSDAREFYTKALGTLKGQIKTIDAPEQEEVKVIEVDEEAERQKEKEIEEACYANRALCNLEMKNYASCTRDSASALKLNPKNLKAWFRAASACYALDKLPAATDACDSGLRFDPSNPSLTHLLTKIRTRETHLSNLSRERLAREESLRQKASTLKLALRTRNIQTRETPNPPDMEDAAISLSDPDDASSTLSFPLILLYPLEGQTDFIKSFLETENLSEHLGYILPPPWDEKGEYAAGEEVECYIETVSGGLIKAGKKLELRKLLGSGKVEVVDGFVRVYVVPRKRGEEWVGEFKLRRGK